MNYFISLVFRDGSNLWWCKAHRHFYNPLRHGYKRGQRQRMHDAIPLDDLTIHKKAAEEWVTCHVPPHACPVMLRMHLVKERKNARK